jgi:DNA replication protein DnaC
MWHEALGEPTVADGILDRLLEHVHRIELHGESLRRGKRVETDGSTTPTPASNQPKSKG